MNQKLENEKTPVLESLEMNDCDYLNDLLETEKNISVNLCIALNEASNEHLFKELYKIFKDVKDCQRNLFELSFSNGWYSLEKAEEQKINQKIKELQQKLEKTEN